MRRSSCAGITCSSVRRCGITSRPSTVCVDLVSTLSWLSVSTMVAPCSRRSSPMGVPASATLRTFSHIWRALLLLENTIQHLTLLGLGFPLCTKSNLQKGTRLAILSHPLLHLVNSGRVSWFTTHVFYT